MYNNSTWCTPTGIQPSQNSATQCSQVDSTQLPRSNPTQCSQVNSTQFSQNNAAQFSQTTSAQFPYNGGMYNNATWESCKECPQQLPPPLHEMRKNLVALAYESAIDDTDAVGLLWKKWHERMLYSDTYRHQFMVAFLSMYGAFMMEYGMNADGEIRRWHGMTRDDPWSLMAEFAFLMTSHYTQGAVMPGRTSSRRC